MTSTTHQLFREQAIGKKKRERTRSTLLDSAVSVFAGKGYEAASIIDITNHAELANGTFYNYYQDKDELLRDVITGLAVEIVRDVNDEMESFSHATTRVIFATARILQLARSQPEWLRVYFEGLVIIPELQSAVVQYLRQDLELGIEQGHFHVDVNLLLVNQFLSLIRIALFMDPEMSDDTVIQTCESVLRLVGVTPRQAKKHVAKVFQQHLARD